MGYTYKQEFEAIQILKLFVKNRQDKVESMGWTSSQLFTKRHKRDLLEIQVRQSYLDECFVHQENFISRLTPIQMQRDKQRLTFFKGRF